jgi:tRNA (cytidine/uridine-2'-O-)-methyltransferase
MHPLFHIVLVEPEIPNNTGNIGRTCVATGCSLHLVKPLGFDTGEHALRRAGLDYWRRLAPIEHDRWADWVRYRDALPADSSPRPRASWVLSTKAARPFWNADLRPGDALIFGKETAGLPDAMIEEAGDRAICLPMLQGERSLNLATAVCAVVMEGVRQCVSRGEIALDALGRFRID